MRESGTYQKLGDLNYFIPFALPPKNPPFELNIEIMTLYGEASFALGQLDEMSQRLPDPDRFIKAYVIKEAMLSSAIEGIHTTLIEVFTHPIGDSKPSKDTQLVLNYTKALDAALKMTQEDKLPLVSRVILGAHEALMSSGDGDRASPGQFRKQSVRVGDLVPPPAQEIPELMRDLERYMNEPSEIPALIRAGLTHVQFETIHPFLDGNGRIGRLLIVLMLIDNGLMSLPILYPSYYFKRNHLEYYQRLGRVQTHGDFEGWIIYYLKAIRDSAKNAYVRAKDIENLEAKIEDQIKNHPAFTKCRDTARTAINFLFSRPITQISEMSNALERTYNTAHNILNLFSNLGIVTETIVHKRNKLYRFEPYIEVLEKEY